MNKKSQVQLQIFIYVFALIVISMIIYFGAKAIFDFKSQTDDVGVVTFQTDLSSIITSVASEYDSVKKVDLVLPRKYKQVCFIDSDTKESDVSDKYPLIKDAVSSGTEDNVFLVMDILEKQFKTTKLDVISPSNFLCIDNAGGHVIFTLKGKSRYAEISG